MVLYFADLYQVKLFKTKFAFPAYPLFRRIISLPGTHLAIKDLSKKFLSNFDRLLENYKKILSPSDNSGGAFTSAPWNNPHPRLRILTKEKSN